MQTKTHTFEINDAVHVQYDKLWPFNKTPDAGAIMQTGVVVGIDHHNDRIDVRVFPEKNIVNGYVVSEVVSFYGEDKPAQ